MPCRYSCRLTGVLPSAPGGVARQKGRRMQGKHRNVRGGVPRRSWVVRLVLVALGGTMLTVGSAGTAAAAPPDMSVDRIIYTHPFTGSGTSMSDNEGSAYVPRDNSLWLVDDNGRTLYEVDATTGALKRTVGGAALEAAPQFGGGPVAGRNRTRDLEALAYDASNDTLYAFSGNCCVTEVVPAAFRLTRQSGSLTVTDYQNLPDTSDFTAAAWNPGDTKLWVGVNSVVRTYDYATNTAGPTSTLISGIRGMDFDSSGSVLYVARTNMRLSAVNWGSRSTAWTFDLAPYGVLDSRGVAVVNGQFFISDGFDSREAGDPLSDAVFVFKLGGQSAPTPSFTADPPEGDAPLQVRFTDTSGGSPYAWKWDFGDGTATSTVQNPSHTFQAAGSYTVTLTATGPGGSSTTTRTVTARGPVKVPVASFSASQTSGGVPLHVEFTDTSDNVPTNWVWDFGDGTTATTQNASHTFDRSGTYTVRLTASNRAGSDTVTKTVTAEDVTRPVATLREPVSSSTSSWRSLRGKATDSGSGVASVRLRVVQKRGLVWYAYRGDTRSWVKARRTRASALSRSRLATVRPLAASSWAYRLPGLRRGLIVVKVSAVDRAGNVAPTRTYDRRLTG